MHRLRNKKSKTKGEEADVPPLPPVSKSGFFAWDKPAPAEPPKVNVLEDALPSSDDFRTSLLMPNLAQRFSILKAEQDALAAAAAREAAGPSSEADACAPPRFAGLSDIAETASLHGSIVSAHDRLTAKSEESRPSEDGSVMNRGRQGEGNVLFGGRQKVYKVTPSRGLKTGTSMEELRVGTGFGRAVCQNDLPSPVYRRKSRDDDAESRNEDLGEPNRNRYTSSSTNSTPTTMTRISTAATSITSQPGASVSAASSPTGTMATGKVRRPLYEQALDQQMQDQQSSALSRLERLASLRTTSSPPGTPSPQRSLSLASTTSRSAMPWAAKISPDIAAEDSQQDTEKAPTSAGLDGFDFGLNARQQPLGPPVAVKDEALAQGPFSPGMLRSNGARQRTPERPVSPVLQRSASHGVGRQLSVRTSSSDLDTRSAFLASNSNSERSSFESERLRNSHESERRFLDAHGNTRKNAIIRVSSYRDSSSESLSVPGSPRSVASRASSDQLSSGLLNTLKPIKNPELTPTSPRFSANIYSAADDSPTLPPGQGLSLLVRQHLRSGSDSSSMYAPSTYTRISRVSRYGVAASITNVGLEPRASGGSAGNIWQYEDLNPDDSDEPVSPTSIYHPNGYPTSPPTGKSLQDRPSLPEIPLEYRTPGNSEPIRRSEDSNTRGDEDWDAPARGRRRAESRAGTEFGENSRPGTRAPSPERSLSRAGGRDSQDWEQQLAFRRQIVQQNLRNQEKIASQQDDHGKDSPTKGLSGGAFGLKSRGRSDTGRSSIIPRSDSGDRVGNGRPEIRHNTGTGKGARGPQRPPLVTHHTFGGTSRSADPLSPSSQRSRNSPPRVRRNPSHEQMGGRGQPMGWQDDWGSPPQGRSQPSAPRTGPLPPVPDGRPGPAGIFKDDLSRAMMTGQSIITDIPSRERSRTNVTEHPMENVRSTFEDEDHRPSAFRRTRGNSLLGGLKQKTTADITPLPTITTSNLGPPMSAGSGATTPASARSPSMVLQQIQSANSTLVPAKKRAVNKFEISEPKLITKTSQMSLVDLPTPRESPDLYPQPPKTSSGASIKTSSGASIKSSRKRTNTLFAAFSRHTSSSSSSADDMPPMPTSMPGTPSEDAVHGHKKIGKLRKSASDGGNLASRARVHEAAHMREPMPAMPLGPAFKKGVNGGMI